jgi:hypothetical protein
MGLRTPASKSLPPLLFWPYQRNGLLHVRIVASARRSSVRHALLTLYAPNGTGGDMYVMAAPVGASKTLLSPGRARLPASPDVIREPARRVRQSGLTTL